MSSRLPVPRSRGRGAGGSRRRLVQLASLLLVLSGLALAAPPTASADPGDPQLGKIKPQLAQQLADKGTATFWVRFTDRPDLSEASTIKDRTERGQYVYDQLTKAAQDSQADTRSLLDSEHASYQTFWATNAIRVEAGSQQLAEDLTAQPEVEALYATFDYRLEKPKAGTNVHTPQAVEWGVANINADDVWSEFGDRGEDIVIGSIDSGTQYDHPALVNQYRGNNGDGTYTHDYNWFDASGTCGDAPCDNNGHGTHTMGTMVGDDGGNNQIGVAPGAKWITANGCCPSDAALISSGQWMLAPTDLEGENPDVSKRPDIINNSWGTELPSNDPFMEDVELAWAASGIFGSWSNGNNGPSCQTSGSPGSRTINYSVGAYDVNNAIAGFSSRGAGQDGEIKPNISAPGVNVRSSVPGNSYANFSGTSMASPHLAGTIALLWSAAASLRGDIDGTRALLDGNAVDVDSTSCGGTADDNNVFGEGRLDALVLLNAAPVGETGTLSGTITDAGSGDPIGGATVAVDGEFDRSTTTGADGTYSLRIPTGDYTVTASAFGYGEATETATVAADEVTTLDFALTAAPSVTVRGTVTDGGGHGWPLYAKVDIAGPAPDVWTDPTTGDYSVELPSGATYSMTVTADLPGYLPSTEDVEVGATAVTHDVAVQVDDSTCNAPGYAFNTAGVTEDFSGETLPDGWTVTDGLDNGQVWSFDDPGGQGNLTGGEGGFAIVDSDNYGPGGAQDTSLVSPVVDMSDLTAPVVGFAQDYNNLGDSADVDVSIDGGATWENVLHQTTDVRGPRTDVLQLPTAAGQSEVQVRFHYYDAEYAWWWQVDDVFVGNRTCDPVEGGLVVGNVRGATGSAGINGATVTSLDQPADKATTKPTPDDPAVDDGFYQLFSSLTGRHPFEASANQFQAQSKTVNVPRNRTVAANFRLGAGHLTVTPTSLATTAKLGGAPKTATFTITNDGTAPVNVELGERDNGFVMQRADGSKQNLSKLSKSEGAPLQRLTAPTSLTATAGGTGKTDIPSSPGTQDAPWTDIADYPNVVMDNAVVNVDGTIYSIAGGDGSASSAAVYAYDPVSLAWTPRADLPGARNAVAAGVVNGTIVATGGWADGGPATDTWTYDAAGDSWSAVADAPVALSASGQAVVDGKLYVVGGCTTAECLPMSNAVAAYDPASDSWQELADYPDSVAFASCAGIDGQVYCTGGNDGSAASAATYAYDPSADSWSPVADAPVDLWASASASASGTLVVTGGVQGGAITNAAFAYDPASDSWTNLPNSNVARYRGGAACGFYKIGGSEGSFAATVDSEMLPGLDDCAAGSGEDVGWLSVDPTTATLEPGASMTVTVTTDPNVPQPGVYSAAVTIGEDAPGTVEAVTVTMTVTPPAAWGKLAGTVNGTSCAGATAPLPGATLQVDSWAGSWTLITGSDGGYAQWFNSGANPLQLIAAKDGYAPQTRQVKLVKGGEVRGDFTLKKARC